MKCPSPYLVNLTDDNGQYYRYYVGCGKCYACLSSRRKQWLFRLLYENIHSFKSFFLTLTINDDNISAHLPVNKLYLRKFVKFLRNHGYKFKYYGIGEYGSKFNRPHYHLMLFFKHDIDRLQLYNDMSKYHNIGFIQLLDFSPRLSNYICHYHINPKSVNGLKTFQIFSKGLGIDFINTPEMIQFMLGGANQIRLYDGTISTIPRYYRKKIGAPPPSGIIQDSYKQIIESISEKKIYELTQEEKNNIIISVNQLYEIKIAKNQKKQK